MKIIRRISCFIREYASVMREKRSLKKRVTRYNENKYSNYYNLMCEWMSITKRGKRISEYLLEKGYDNIAVYGFEKIGILAVDEFIDNGICVQCVIDKNTTNRYRGIEIINVNNIEEKNVSVIVITTTYEYLSVASILCDCTTAKLISLEDVIHDIYRRG